MGLLNVASSTSTPACPPLATLNQPQFWVFLIGLVLIIALLVLKVKGAVLIPSWSPPSSASPSASPTPQDTVSFTEACQALPSTFLVIFRPEGLPSLFSDLTKLPLALIAIFSFVISDTFDTIGTFIGTGRRTGIFTAEDQQKALSGSGLSSKLDRACLPTPPPPPLAPCSAPPHHHLCGERRRHRRGRAHRLTSVVVALCFALSAFLAGFVSAIPFAATAPALIAVGVMMLSSFREIQWTEFDEAVPAFFAGIFMALCYNISYGHRRRLPLLLHHQNSEEAGQGHPPPTLR